MQKSFGGTSTRTFEHLESRAARQAYKKKRKANAENQKYRGNKHLERTGLQTSPYDPPIKSTKVRHRDLPTYTVSLSVPL